MSWQDEIDCIKGYILAPEFVESALAALAEIQAASNAYRSALDMLDRKTLDGDAAFLLVQAAVARALTALPVLDDFLTDLSGGKIPRPTEGHDFENLLSGCATFHLSDGGYSRLTIDLAQGTVGIDRSLSTAKAIARWEILKRGEG